MLEIQQPPFLFPVFFSKTGVLLSRSMQCLLLKQDTVIDDKNSKLKQLAINILTRNQEKLFSSCRIPLAELVLEGYMHLLSNIHPCEPPLQESCLARMLVLCASSSRDLLESTGTSLSPAYLGFLCNGLYFTGLTPSPQCLSTEPLHTQAPRLHGSTAASQCGFSQTPARGLDNAHHH